MIQILLYISAQTQKHLFGASEREENNPNIKYYRTYVLRLMIYFDIVINLIRTLKRLYLDYQYALNCNIYSVSARRRTLCISHEKYIIITFVRAK